MNHFGCILEGPVDAFLRTERRLERRLVAWGAGALKTPQDPPQYPPATSQRRPRDPPRPSRPPPRRFQKRHNTTPRCPKIPQTPPEPPRPLQDPPRRPKAVQDSSKRSSRRAKRLQRTTKDEGEYFSMGGGRWRVNSPRIRRSTRPPW